MLRYFIKSQLAEIDKVMASLPLNYQLVETNLFHQRYIYNKTKLTILDPEETSQNVKCTLCAPVTIVLFSYS